MINAHESIINRPFVYTQDCLNYLHNIFERYHGLLDQQTSPYWKSAPNTVRKALAELNLAVHRCESVSSGNQPRFVCTWYGMPKTHTLDSELQKVHGDQQVKFGTVYLNYCEIGKTLEDLTKDRDNYIGDDAFRPFNHYSADFVVRFFEDSINDLAQRVMAMSLYYQQNNEFFAQRGYTEFANPRLLPLRFPVAELIETEPRDQIIEQIRQHQTITRVELE